ncbi:MAG TPA: stage II sporulation protein M [Nitrosopumilaceae archaeon]|nr:stage II sporulation protein M [Nitrosopumilaceae archaeon]
MFRKKRILIGFIFAGIFATSFSVGAEIKISQDDAKTFLKEFEQAVVGIDAIGIFTHNASIGLPMFIPGFGVAWGLFASASTGLAFSAIASTSPLLAKIPPIAILVLSPFGIMEFAAYSIGMSRSFILIWAIIKKNPIKQEIRPTIIEIGIVIALLLAGGFIESAMISQYGSNIHLKS